MADRPLDFTLLTSDNADAAIRRVRAAAEAAAASSDALRRATDDLADECDGE